MMLQYITDLKEDLARYGTPSFKNFLKQYFLPRGGTYRYNFWFRSLQASKRRKVSRMTIGMIIYIIYRHFEYKYGIHANPNINIGGGLKIVHGSGVYLNCESIGNNFTVYQGVTLGTKGGCANH